MRYFMRVAFMIFMRAGGCLLARLDNQGSLATNHLWEIRSSTDLAVRAVRVKKSKIESARSTESAAAREENPNCFGLDFQHDKYSRAFLSSVCPAEHLLPTARATSAQKSERPSHVTIGDDCISLRASARYPPFPRQTPRRVSVRRERIKLACRCFLMRRGSSRACGPRATRLLTYPDPHSPT